MIRDRIISRQTRQTASREQMDTRGSVNINKVDQALYRPDVGFKLTNTGYDKYTQGEQEFNKQYGEVVSSNTASIKNNKSIMQQLSDAQGSIEAIDPEDLWKQTTADFVPTVIGTSEGTSTDTVYMLPRDVADKLTKSDELTALYYEVNPNEVTSRDQWISNSGSNDWQYGMVDPKKQNVLVVSPVFNNGQATDVNGIADALSNVETQIKTEFMKQLQPKLDEAAAAYTEYEGKKKEAQGYIDTSQGYLDQAEQANTSRSLEKEAYKNQYTQSVAQRQALFR